MHRLDHGVAKMESAIREKDEEIAGFRRQLAERQPVFFAVSLPVAESNMDLRDPLPPRGEAEMIPSATLSRLPVGMARDLQPPEPASTSGSGSASCSASSSGSTSCSASTSGSASCSVSSSGYAFSSGSASCLASSSGSAPFGQGRSHLRQRSNGKVSNPRAHDSREHGYLQLSWSEKRYRTEFFSIQCK